MKLSTFCFDPATRWSVENFPKLDSVNTLLIVFAAAKVADHPDMLQELIRAYPKSTLIGCTTAGEIAGSRMHDESASVAVLKFERSHFVLASSIIAQRADSFAAGRQLGASLSQKNLSGVFVLCDGLTANASEVLNGMHSVLPPDVTVTGGLASNGLEFTQSRVICNATFQPRMVTAVGFYGECLQITHGAYNGCRAFGPERRVTRSQANVLYELDGKPALLLYKEYLGKLSATLPCAAQLLPLSIRQDKHGSCNAIRTMLGFDEASQSMILSDNIPNGYLAQLMHIHEEDPAHGASQAAADALDSMAIAGPMLAITVSGIGRRMKFGQRIEEECEAVLHALPHNAQQIGFYSYGEIAPYAEGQSALHNQSIVITTISEA